MKKPIGSWWLLGISAGFLVIPQATVADDPPGAAAKTLADLLQPGQKMTGIPLEGKNNIPLAKSLEGVPPLLPFYRGLPPRALLKGQGQPLQPRSLREGIPLANQRDMPSLPQLLELPAGELVQLPAVDVQSPVALPILAQHQRERAPLADPTMAASLAAVLGELSPARLAAVPFSPVNLPDPFEHSQAVRLQNPPAENPFPVSVSPRLPSKP